MAVPKHKTSKSKKNMRRAHDALTPSPVSRCSRCNQIKRPHRVCSNCGYYDGVKKLDISAS